MAQSIAHQSSQFETPKSIRETSIPNAPKKLSMFEKAPEIPVLNPALRQLGIDILEQYFATIYNETTDPIVSIGSGNGHVERHMEIVFGKPICCVDPNQIPNQNQDLYKTSEYLNVHDLLNVMPNLKNNSTLFINWSTPNDSTYDFEAIKAVNPTNVLVVFESTGSGGGTLFQKWLNFCGVVTDEKFTKSDVTLYDFPVYNIIHSTLSRIEKPPYGQFEYSIVWLSRTLSHVENCSIPKYIGIIIPRKSFDPTDYLIDCFIDLAVNFSVDSSVDFSIDSIKSCLKPHASISNYENTQNEITKSTDPTSFDIGYDQFLGEFLQPATELDDLTLTEMKNVILNMEIGNVIECHHPYYREHLREFGKLHNMKLVSHVDESLKKHDDSMLLYHFACKKCTPVAKVRWYPASSNCDSKMAMTALCEHCPPIRGILTDYKGINSSELGYKYVRGKNCLKFVAKI